MLSANLELGSPEGGVKETKLILEVVQWATVGRMRGGFAGAGAGRLTGVRRAGFHGRWWCFYSGFIQGTHYVTLGLSHSLSTAASPSVK